MERHRRIAAYGLCHDDLGRVLLVRSSAVADLPGVWQLPGGGIEHGEHPEWAVVREFAEETGLVIGVIGVHEVVSDVTPLPFRDTLLHHDRVIFDVTVRGGRLRDELAGTTDLVCWVAIDELPDLPLMPFTARALGRPVDPAVVRTMVRDSPPPPPAPRLEPTGPRGQRFAAYGLVTDPDGRVLLTQISHAYPGAGRWHLPGGGTNHGEQPEEGFLRELREESGQLGRVTGLLRVSHRRNPAARGPEGFPIDWHSVRVSFIARVDSPGPLMVLEETGGSTAAARWFEPAEAASLPLTDVAAAALQWLARTAGGVAG